MASRRAGQLVKGVLLSQRSKSGTKFGNHRVVVDSLGRFWTPEQAKRMQIVGDTCDSQLEAKHLLTLRERLRRGEITHLRHPHPFELHVNGALIGELRADFSFIEVATQRLVVHDCKGRSDPSRDVEYRFFRWKCKHVLAEYGIVVVEIREQDLSSRAQWTRRLDGR